MRSAIREFLPTAIVVLILGVMLGIGLFGNP